MQVVIRLKPVNNDAQNSKSVYLSQEQEKTLVVETPNKKEYFVFDNIADEACSQQDLYEYIGHDAVKSSTQVNPPLPRDTTAASSRTARLAPERPTPSWATRTPSPPTTTAPTEASSPASSTTSSAAARQTRIVTG